MKFGKQPFYADSQDFLFAKYRLPTPLPPHPATWGHATPATAAGLYGNGPDPALPPKVDPQGVGDCTVCGIYHLIQTWTAAAGAMSTFTTPLAITAYEKTCGYVPGKSNTDRGGQLRTLLKYWQKTGFSDASGKIHKIAAYLLIPPTDLASLEEANWLYSGTYSGLQVPASMMAQIQAGKPLTVVRGSPIEGGHCMPLAGWQASYVPAMTWGQIVDVTLPFLTTYYDEHWVVLTQDQLNGKGLSPEGFNLAQLQADLKAL